MTRADRNNNPTAFTTDVAREAGLVLGVDYVPGDPFPEPSTLVTAKLVGDPIEITIRVIDELSFVTQAGNSRWSYINIPQFLWEIQKWAMKVKILKFMYEHEGGTELMRLFK